MILSPARLKTFRSLMLKQGRTRNGAFLVEGPQAVGEALRSKPEAIKTVLMTDIARVSHSDLLQLVLQTGTEFLEASDVDISRLSQAQSPQGVIAISRFIDVKLETLPTDQNAQFIFLNNIRDPGNLGNIIRTADAAGVAGVLLTSGSVDIYNPKVVRASTGSIFNVPIVTGVALEECIASLKQFGIRVIAADVSGRSISDLEQQTIFHNAIVWLFGNEAHGLSNDDIAVADEVVSVPIFGRAESLSLQTAAAICVYQSSFARQGKKSRSRPLG